MSDEEETTTATAASGKVLEEEGAAEAAGPSAKDKYAERMKRLRSLHGRRAEARKLNQAEVVEEDRRAKLPTNWEARQRREAWQLAELEARKAAEAKGEDYDRTKLLNVQADAADREEAAKKRKKNPNQGFVDFEDMTLRAYQRNVKTVKTDRGDYERQKKAMGAEFYPSADSLIQGSHYPSDDACDRLVADLKKSEERRDKYHRRRLYDPDAPIDFINERNRRFNEKIERFYGEHTKDVKDSLERGTAV